MKTVKSSRNRSRAVKGSEKRSGITCLLLLLTSICCSLPLVGQTVYTEPWTSTLDGWAYTQTSCSGICTDALLTSDGNPADSVHDSVTGRNKAEVGYWSKAMTWEAMGVSAGDTVNTVDGQWDDFSVCTAVACGSAHQAGIQIYDSSNATEITASTVEPLLGVSGDTSAWTTHNPTGAVAVNSGYQTSSTSVTVRFNVNPDCGNNSSAVAEIRGDNLKLTITSTAPSGRKRVIVTYLELPRAHLAPGSVRIHTPMVAIPPGIKTGGASRDKLSASSKIGGHCAKR